MSTPVLTYDYRNAPVVLPEASRKAPSLKWNWSTEGELEVDFKTFVVKSVSDRRLGDASVSDVSDLAQNEGEAR